MIDETLRISTPSGQQVLGRITGNEDSDQIIVFSHGFGVKSDSRGMFNLLVDVFKKRYLTVRFHYVVVDDLTQETIASSYTEQAEKLQTVVERVRQRFGNKEIVLIAHSQGCFISSMALIQGLSNITRHVLLAPPPTENVSERTKAKFKSRNGAVLNETGRSIYPRTDGSKTIILPSYWKDAENIHPLELYRDAFPLVHTTVIWGTQDTTIQQENFARIQELHPSELYQLPNGHEFMEDKLKGVIDILSKKIL